MDLAIQGWKKLTMVKARACLKAGNAAESGVLDDFCEGVGDFGWTLTVTDCTTGWAEVGAVRTKAEAYVLVALASRLHRHPGGHLPAFG